VLSLYALVRNSYDPMSGEFHLSARDIELDGHLDGNLCRCTGYKPILNAAKTFITEDLKGKIAFSSLETGREVPREDGRHDIPYNSESNPNGPVKTRGSCNRPGGCCQDTPKPTTDEKSTSLKTSDDSSDSGSIEHSGTSETSLSSPDEDVTSFRKPIKSNEDVRQEGSKIEGTKTTTNLGAVAVKSKEGVPQYQFTVYSPSSYFLRLSGKSRRPLFIMEIRLEYG